jgi:hypothetical protein
MKKIVTIVLAFAVSAVFTSPATAATAVVKLDKSTDLAIQNQQVVVTVENFPRKAGIYLMQCVESATPGARPTICNQAVQLWISFIPGASFTPTSPITMKLDGKFGATDCTTVKCGVFVRYDHTASADFSEDQFLPITFSNPVQSVLFEKTALKVGKSLKLPTASDAGNSVRYRVQSKSRKVCSVKKNVVKATATGTCVLKVNVPEGAGKAALSETLRVRVSK